YRQTGEDMFDAYWHTLAMGNVGDGYGATKDQFCQWKRLHPAKIPSSFGSKWLQWTNLPVGICNAMSRFISTWRDSFHEDAVVAFTSKLETIQHRRFFKTTNGFIGIGPRLLNAGDTV